MSPNLLEGEQMTDREAFFARRQQMRSDNVEIYAGRESIPLFSYISERPGQFAKRVLKNVDTVKNHYRKHFPILGSMLILIAMIHQSLINNGRRKLVLMAPFILLAVGLLPFHIEQRYMQPPLVVLYFLAGLGLALAMIALMGAVNTKLERRNEILRAIMYGALMFVLLGGGVINVRGALDRFDNLNRIDRQAGEWLAANPDASGDTPRFLTSRLPVVVAFYAGVEVKPGQPLSGTWIGHDLEPTKSYDVAAIDVVPLDDQLCVLARLDDRAVIVGLDSRCVEPN